MNHCVQPHQRGTTLLQPSRSWQTTALLARTHSSESSTEVAALGETGVEASGETNAEEKVDPYELVKEDIMALSDNIKMVILAVSQFCNAPLKLQFNYADFKDVIMLWCSSSAFVLAFRMTPFWWLHVYTELKFKGPQECLNLHSHDLRVPVGSLARFKLCLPHCNVPGILNCMSGRLNGFPCLY